MTTEALSLERRLARWRLAHGTPASGPASAGTATLAAERADRLAAGLGGEVVDGRAGPIVRIERPERDLVIDRDRLAALPGHPAGHVPLVCLDTETTGLGTAAGTYAFLVGLGWWDGDRFRQVQLLLPDEAAEPALLAAVAATIPADAWLVTYNGRGFDWPLLESRYRLRRTTPPTLAGHLDLLPFVRRVYRHRLPDARLRTVERYVLGLDRIGDVEGWQIPGRYLEVLRGASPALLADVVHHNHLDVLSLALVVAHAERQLGSPRPPVGIPPGDLAGLGRAYRRAGRPDEALACLDQALDRVEDEPGDRRRIAEIRAPWWSPDRPADLGGPADPARRATPRPDGSPWTFARIAAERARLLRALGRDTEAADAWRTAAVAGGRSGVLAWVEVAKLCEHRLGDPAAALAATERARALVERGRLLGRPDGALERAIGHRAARLRRRLVGRPLAVPAPAGRSVRRTVAAAASPARSGRGPPGRSRAS